MTQGYSLQFRVQSDFQDEEGMGCLKKESLGNEVWEKSCLIKPSLTFSQVEACNKLSWTWETTF